MKKESMRVVVHPTASEFLAVVEEPLLGEEALNNLILGIAARVRDGVGYGDAPPYFVTVEDDKQLLVAALRTPPHPLVLATPAEGSDAISLLADHLVEADPELGGVNGPAEAAAAFARLWAQRRRVQATVTMQTRIHELREVIAPSGVPGRMRPAEENNLDLLAEWVDAFRAEAVPDDPPTDPRGTVQRFLDVGVLAVWDDGGPVSMAGSSRSSPRGASVSLVYTPPEHRGKGYASACVAALSQLLLARGFAFCTLYTDLANPISNRIYRRIGYRPVADCTTYRFEPI